MQTTNWVYEGTWALKVKVISWPWPKAIYVWKLKHAFLRNHWPFLTNFVWRLLVTWKLKFVDMMLVTWPRWPPCPYMVIALKNLLLQNLVCSIGTPAHYSLFKWWPWSDLELFYGKVKFGNLGFSIGKYENSGFFSNYCSQWPEIL